MKNIEILCGVYFKKYIPEAKDAAGQQFLMQSRLKSRYSSWAAYPNLALSYILILFFFTSPLANAKDSERIKPEVQVTITLYYLPYCPYCQEVLNYLKKIKRTIPLKNVKNNSAAKEELLKMGGILEVPCLIVEDRAIYRSKPIIEWLQEHQNELYTAPANPV